MENNENDYTPFTESTFDKWEQEWKIEHPVLNWIDEKLLHNKGIADYRGSYSLTHPWVIVKYAWRKIRYAWQRAFRGWDDTVIWSIDWHLAKMIPLWMRQLKEDKHGVPNMCFKESDYNDKEHDYALKDGAWERAEKEYDDVLEKIAIGFESYLAREEYKYETDEEKDQLTKNFEEGFDLLRQYYGTFWD